MYINKKYSKSAIVSLIVILMSGFNSTTLFAQVEDQIADNAALPIEEGAGYAYYDSVDVKGVSADLMYQNAIYFLREDSGRGVAQTSEVPLKIHDVILLEFPAPHTEDEITLNFDLGLLIYDRRYDYKISDVRVLQSFGDYGRLTPLKEVLDPDLEQGNVPAYARDLAVAADNAIRDFLDRLHLAMILERYGN